MVLADLGRRLNQAFSDLQRQPVVDEASIDTLLKHVCNALLGSDVNVQLVQSLRQNVKAEVRTILNEKGESLSDAQRKNQVQRVMFDHLVKLVDPGEGSTTHRLEKGKQNVIMYVLELTQVCRSAGLGQDDVVYKARAVVPEAWLQGRPRVCRHLPCRCL